MNPYNENSPCAKCGNQTATSVYCPGKALPGHVPGCTTDGEHIHRKCSRCGYEWLEATLS